jgi:cytochrome c556
MEEQVLDNLKLRIGSALACVVMAMGGVSCQREHRASTDQGSVRSGVMGQHWVQDERLRGVMAELSRQSAHWPAGVPDDPESRNTDSETSAAFRDAAALADGLARAARDIPRAVADREMSAETRRGFKAAAERLRTQALALRDAARGRKVEPMQRALDGISSSCISCHSQYRDFTGELGPRKASAE